MSREYPQRLMVIGGPEPRGAVVSGGREVVAVRRPAYIPHWEPVSAENDQARPALQRPQPHWTQIHFDIQDE